MRFEMDIPVTREEGLARVHVLVQMASSEPSEAWYALADSFFAWIMTGDDAMALALCYVVGVHHRLPFSMERMPSFLAFANHYRERITGGDAGGHFIAMARAIFPEHLVERDRVA